MAATNPNTNSTSTNPTYTTTNKNTAYSSTNPNPANTTMANTAGPNTTSTSSTTTGPATGNSAGREAASGIKGAFAAVHGAGEAIRGTVNSAVDNLGNDPQGIAKNETVAQGGMNEMATGEFTQGTKNREGVIPGDKERRY